MKDDAIKRGLAVVNFWIDEGGEYITPRDMRKLLEAMMGSEYDYETLDRLCEKQKGKGWDLRGADFKEQWGRENYD